MPRPPRAGVPASLRTLLDTAAALARRAPSARVAEARAADLLPGVDWGLPAPEPLDHRVVERILREQWGRPPGKVLEDWDPEPLAVRAAAQVHRGAAAGTAVAVKVLRPGLAAVVRADLALLEALVPPLRAAFPRLDLAGVLAEVREATLDELDLEQEGDMQRLIGRALRAAPGVVVPRVHGELTTEAVLVTDLVGGTTLRDGGRPASPADAAGGLIRAHADAVRRTGLIPTDPRPGHVVVDGDRLGLLGVGAARPWHADRLDALVEVVAALRDPDGAGALGDVLDRLKVLPARDAPAAHAVAREVLGELLLGPARLDADALSGVARRALAHAAELAGLAARATPQPADLAGLRAAGQLAATLASLEATLDWVDLLVSQV